MPPKARARLVSSDVVGTISGSTGASSAPRTTTPGLGTGVGVGGTNVGAPPVTAAIGPSAGSTTTVPDMLCPCSPQMYLYVPTVMKRSEELCPRPKFSV
jgi:hypothetical protein